ncbi:hypothetical protein FHU30_000345 [Actinomadura rupiterrae]|nr:hypothetical protein [Actinomadura rupiterrae]
MTRADKTSAATAAREGDLRERTARFASMWTILPANAHSSKHLMDLQAHAIEETLRWLMANGRPLSQPTCSDRGAEERGEQD